MAKRVTSKVHPAASAGRPRSQDRPVLPPLPAVVDAWMDNVWPQAPDLYATFLRITRMHSEVPSHVRSWLKEFQGRVAEIAPRLIKAETDRMLAWVDELLKVNGGRFSDLWIQQYKETIKKNIEREQVLVAEGRVFREEFSRMMDVERSGAPSKLNVSDYFNTQHLCAAWLVGFSNDEALRQQWERQRMAEEQDKVCAARRHAEERKVEGRQKGTDRMREKGQATLDTVRRMYREGAPWPKDKAAQEISKELHMSFSQVRKLLRGS